MVRLLSTAAVGFGALLIAAGLLAASSASAAGDPAKGKGVFAAQCSVCHSNARNGPVILGPPLFGVVGRKAASVNGFSYSSAMKAAGFAWTPDHLRAYLPAPQQYLPGVRMTYPGLKNPPQLEDLIAYLGSLK
jgi:cytochrome c